MPLRLQCQRMWALLDAGKSRLDLPALNGCFGDHKAPICKHLTPQRAGGTLRAMIFNTAK